jgi:hypothetical protein
MNLTETIMALTLMNQGHLKTLGVTLRTGRVLLNFLSIY